MQGKVIMGSLPTIFEPKPRYGRELALREGAKAFWTGGTVDSEAKQAKKGTGT